MDGVQLPQDYSHFEEAVYFLPLSSQKFLVLNLGATQWFRTCLTTRPLLHLKPIYLFLFDTNLYRKVFFQTGYSNLDFNFNNSMKYVQT